MPFMKDLFSETEFARMRDEGYVRVQYHPTYPYAIANYTERAQYAREWNPVTLQCRGLIYRTDTREIIARPFPKFFNYEEMTNRGAEFDLGAPVRVTDKLDGSLGIIYPTPEHPFRDRGWAVATRGSFTSEQAVKATDMLQSLLMNGAAFDTDVTDLVEIIYPNNRIVVDYGDAEKLVWLGAVDHETGVSYQDHASMPSGWPSAWIRQEFPRVETLGDALAMEPRPNAEGVVVHFLRDDTRVKIKQADYVRLHRIVTGLNARAVWEAMRDNRYDALEADVPEEFLPWLEDVYATLNWQYMATAEDMLRLYNRAPHDADRKTFALYVIDHYASTDKRVAAYMFVLLDGKPIEPMIWDDIKPSADWALHNSTEEAA